MKSRHNIILPIILGLLFISTQAEAKKYRHYRGESHTQQQPNFTEDIMRPFSPTFGVLAPNTKREQRQFLRGDRRASYDSGSVIAHPSGCPSRAFCGCGASVEKFGRPIRSLFLAAAWFKFPRADRAPGMAMVRSHHVAILKHHVQGTLWMVYDANSGGHRTRLHVRDTAGWTIVNPTHA